MSDKKSPSTSRRDVLKATGGAAAVGLLGTTAVSAQVRTDSSELPDGVRVFIGGNTDFGDGQPSTASLESSGLEQAGLGNADLVIISPETNVSRGNLVAALKQGKPIVTVGKRAFDGLLSVIYDIPVEDVEQAIEDGTPKEGHDLPYSFGFEYSKVQKSNISLVVPANGALNTVRLKRNSSTFETVVEQLGERFTSRKTSNMSVESTSESDSQLIPTAGICPPGATQTDDGWNCLGTDELDVSSPCPYGGWDRKTYGAKLKEDDSEND